MVAPASDSQVTPEPALVEGLRVAVPLRIAELQHTTSAERDVRIRTWAREAGDMVAHHGDMLMFRVSAGREHTNSCRQQGWQHCDCLVGTAQVFNALVRGLAAGAHMPGGVTLFGLHWCTTAHQRCPNRTLWGIR